MFLQQDRQVETNCLHAPVPFTYTGNWLTHHGSTTILGGTLAVPQRGSEQIGEQDCKGKQPGASELV